MATKQKKKRTKKYQGADAKISTPSVTRVSAEERSRYREWWLAYGQLVRAFSALVGFIALAILLVIGVIGLL